MQMSRNIEKYTKINCENLIKIYHFSFDENEGACSQSQICSILYECYQPTLYDFIYQKVQIRQDIREDYIIQMVAGVINGLSQLQNNNFFHPGLNPFKITYDPHHYFKITITDYIHKIIQAPIKKSNCYLAPEQFYQLNQQNQQPTDYEKCLIFQLGLLALQMATLENITQTIYDFENLLINIDVLQKKIEQGGSKYSKKFLKLLDRMLSLDPNIRLNFDEIQQFLEYKPSGIQATLVKYTEMSEQLDKNSPNEECKKYQDSDIINQKAQNPLINTNQPKTPKNLMTRVDISPVSHKRISQINYNNNSPEQIKRKGKKNNKTGFITYIQPDGNYLDLQICQIEGLFNFAMEKSQISQQKVKNLLQKNPQQPIIENKKFNETVDERYSYNKNYIPNDRIEQQIQNLNIHDEQQQVQQQTKQQKFEKKQFDTELKISKKVERKKKKQPTQNFELKKSSRRIIDRYNL